MHLVPGHNHQGADWNRSLIADVFPSPDGRWWVGVYGTRFDGFREPVEASDVDAALRWLRFPPEAVKWANWAGSAHEHHPFYDRPDTVWHEPEWSGG